jgi:hypothetical protein
MSSGNNVGPIRDMCRRCITIWLDPRCENPATRKFRRPDLLAWVWDRRSELVSAALTIIRAWITAGRPRKEVNPVASYAVWSDLCRQPLLWLGQPDPATRLFEQLVDDPDVEILGRMLTAWGGLFGGAETKVRVAVTEALSCATDAQSDLLDALRDIADDRGQINRHKVS